MATRCHELEGVGRYADRAELYALARPSYPPEAIDHILAAAPAAYPRILDLGAGTGIGTRLLRGRGAEVIAVEPSLDMARVGLLEAVGARAETLPFRDGIAGLVTVFNAFHWFQPEPALREIRRVLGPEGRLALVWNDWDHRHAFTHEFVTLMRSVAGDFPPEDRDAEVAPLYRSECFEDVQRRDFPNVHRLDAPRLAARLRSMSYVPLEGAEPLMQQLAALHARYADAAGIVEHHYVTAVFVARRSARIAGTPE